MNLLRSLCCLFGGRCPEKNLSPPKELCEVRHPAILAKRKPNEKGPAKSNSDRWRAGQRVHPVESLSRA
jgi:hypothetical protein